MHWFVVSVSLLCALPCALGIVCYSCKPGLESQLCDKAISNSSKVANCTATALPGVTYDACMTTMMTMEVGPLKKSAFLMTCANMKVCSKLKEDKSCPNGTASIIETIPKAKLAKCAVACCQGDKCNTMKIVNEDGTKASAAFSTASFVVSALSLGFGFILS